MSDGQGDDDPTPGVVDRPDTAPPLRASKALSVIAGISIALYATVLIGGIIVAIWFFFRLEAMDFSNW